MLELSNSVVVNNSGIAEWDNSVVVEMNIHIYIPVRLTNILVSNTSFILLFCSVPYFNISTFLAYGTVPVRSNIRTDTTSTALYYARFQRAATRTIG